MKQLALHNIEEERGVYTKYVLCDKTFQLIPIILCRRYKLSIIESPEDTPEIYIKIEFQTGKQERECFILYINSNNKILKKNFLQQKLFCVKAFLNIKLGD